MTAVLEQLSGPLCDAVPDARAAPHVLEALERGNVFVIPLDPGRRWYPLPRPLPQHAPPPARAAARRTASPTCTAGRARGTPSTAICTAPSSTRSGAATDTSPRTRSAELARPLQRRRGRPRDGWIDRMPATILRRVPGAALARGGVARAMGPHRGGRAVAPVVEQRGGRHDDELQRHELSRPSPASARCCRLTMADIGGAVRARPRRPSTLRPAGCPRPADAFFLGICLFWTRGPRGGRVAVPRATLDDAGRATGRAPRLRDGAARAGARRARRARRGGRLIDASLGTSEERGLASIRRPRPSYVASGIVLLARGDAEGAEARSSTRRRSPAAGRPGRGRAALLWLGRCRAGARDRAGAEEAGSAAGAMLAGARARPRSSLRGARGRAPRADARPGARRRRGPALSPAELRVLELLPATSPTARSRAGCTCRSTRCARTAGGSAASSVPRRATRPSRPRAATACSEHGPTRARSRP